MEPTVGENQVVWVNHWAYFFSKPKVGDIVIFNYQGKRLIKRIVKKLSGSFEIAGDNKKDSLNLGPINYQSIEGKVVGIK